jgi:hypothetical protein
MASRKPAAERAAARSVAALTTFQLQLRVELRGIEPLIWRRILVPETITLSKLNGILLRAMGWAGGHLHEYEIARQRYGIPDEDWPDPEPLIDERRVRLKPLVEDGLKRFTYVYDLGDHWEHRIVVEDVVVPKPNQALILCTAGENACPPEDVGGAPGYAEFLEVLADPGHEDHKHMKEWAGGSFDPAAFDLAETNERLADIKI